MLPRWDSVRVDGTLVAYAAALVVATTLITGLLPVIWIRRDVADALKAAGRSGDRSASKALRSGLVIAEIALAVAVVISAGLLVRSFATLTRSQLGFDPANVVQVRDVGLSMSSSNFAGRVRTIDTLLSDFGRIPGVTAAAGAHWLPFSGEGLKITTSIPADAAVQHDIAFDPVTAGYFRVFHIPLLAGRTFASTDTLQTRPVAIVSASLARTYYGGIAQALGRTVFPKMDIGGNTVVPRAIVGVVGDTRNTYSADPQPQIYAAMSQFPLLFNFVIRTDGRTAGLAKSIDGVFARRAPTIAPPVLVPYTTLLSEDALNAHAAALLFGVFAIVALLLALAGIYAVTAYAAEQRTQEFGIRRAVGAQDMDVMRDVIARALFYGTVGAIAGLALAALATRSVSSLLFQTSPFDPLTFASVVVLLLTCTVLAAIVPALRAIRITPIEALRYE
jgi:predicted permease